MIEEPEDRQVDSFAKLKLLPGVVTNLGRIAAECDYDLVMVSNQDGLGTASLPNDAFYPVHDFLLDLLAREGIRFTEVCIDCSFDHEAKPTRKPGTGMLEKFVTGDYDLRNSFVIGDRSTDVELARNLGCQSIFIENQNFSVPASPVAKVVSGWAEIYEFLKVPPRKAAHQRKTRETDVSLEMDLDGTGTRDIATGLPFLDHMLEQLAAHGGFDLTLRCNGDLEVDEHHTIEDVAIALGETFSMALGEKRGIERYGFTVPMDDCLATVAVDLSGRSYLVWDAEFKREMIGKVPTEMFQHFFRSFADAARCNINIKVDGINEHHKIESIFKAFARALKSAVRRDPASQIKPSTKGVL